MKLPAGKHVAYIKNPLKEQDVQGIVSLIGFIRMTMGNGHAFIVIDNGKLLAAAFFAPGKTYKGAQALEVINAGESEEMELREYSEEELHLALDCCRREDLLLVEGDTTLPALPDLLDESNLNRVLKQPGVIAVSAFSEGFAVQSLGKADFDQVAAMAEDLLRAGIKIAEDMKIGRIDQIILETGSGKIIIAPYGDLFLCVFTGNDANLGLIRMALKSLQDETPH
jgi:predicted regulator of Ras-like GTPase activity (Roadblock/LC7/MglB family)